MSAFLQGGKKCFKQLLINPTLTRDFSHKGLRFSRMGKDKNIRKPTFTFVVSDSVTQSFYFN